MMFLVYQNSIIVYGNLVSAWDYLGHWIQSLWLLLALKAGINTTVGGENPRIEDRGVQLIQTANIH